MSEEIKGSEKARAIRDKIAGEVEEEKEETEATKDIALAELTKNKNIGLKNIDAEDIKPPMAFLVQGNIDKTELVDSDGKECPDGSFYLKGTNEVFKTIDSYLIWLKKEHFKAGDEASESDSKWDGSRMYRAILVRKSDMMPFAITFKKSSLNAASDLLTSVKSKNLPVYLFNVVLKAVETTNKSGQTYFKSVLGVGEIEKDIETLGKLFKLASGFDFNDEVSTDESGSTPTTRGEDTEEEKGSDDIPF